MLPQLGCILFLSIAQHRAQIESYSDIDLYEVGTQFQPADPIELLAANFASSLVNCGQACNNHVQCRTFDYDMRSSICRLFEGSVETGQIVLSGLIVSRAGAVRHSLNLYAAFGRPCVQCAQSRYLICSSNNTCQCPLKTVWNSVKCVNQGYEDATCLSNQWCRIDRGYTCSNLHFCTEYSCRNMTIAKADLPGNDLTYAQTSNYTACCSWCQNYPSCRAFTWVKAPGMFYSMCYLKWSSGGGGTPSIYHISAYY